MAKTKNKTATKAAEQAPTDATAKPSADERAAKAAAAKAEHRDAASTSVKEHLSTINTNISKLLDAAEAGKTDAKAFGQVKAAIKEFKTAVNKLGIHVAPAAKSDD